MLTAEQNELVTRVGPGTPMGETIRRYWMPALLSWEIAEPDCPPVRVKLLGENLVGFRDTNGRVGILEEFCAHREASLFYGRNEECGLRCVYHGWKYDVEGHCVDMMNEPEELNYKSKIRLVSYPAIDIGGVIWTYMGDPANQPPPPLFDWTQAPETHRNVNKVWQESNWLQALEGGIDTSHAPILHGTLTADTGRPGFSPANKTSANVAPFVEFDTTAYGFRYFGIRQLSDGDTYVRAYHYVMPFHQIRPSRGSLGERESGHMWVPMDDENCMVYNWSHHLGEEPIDDEARLDRMSANGPLDVDQKNGFRSIRNRDNGYMLDREVQKNETFTGIEGINCQDRAIQESMGRIVDRTKEHLGPADLGIMEIRKSLMAAISTVQDGGMPPGVNSSYYTIRATEKFVPEGVDWREAIMPRMSTTSV